ncbi:MAG TPA: SGNH/GDSL hydrolase family protein [Candidatus Binatia bacterium]|nr:SGNH/GDSL hydrolase family protein [Candidatus Binatia bacterium]
MRRYGLRSVVLAAGVLCGSAAFANTLTQNSSWTVDRSGTSTKYRVVAYGDSIYAGYNGSITSAAIGAAPMVQGDYASNYWGTDVEIVRRCKSGAIASDIYNNKIVAEKSYMQATNTRIVTFEMCGNDGLQARSNFAGQTGTCNYTQMNNAVANCTTYTQAAMQFINANAYSGTKLKIVTNLYYPGYDADNALANCTDPTTGQRPNKQSTFLPFLARMNWRACNFANANGFACADSFANYMGADYDSNGDGQIDSDALKYVQGESENAYVTRITTTLRSTIRDANVHLVSPTSSFDYIQSDNTHPTYDGGTQLSGIFGGSNGSGPPDFTPAQFVNGKNPVWNRFGHERMGWALSTFNPATP